MTIDLAKYEIEVATVAGPRTYNKDDWQAIEFDVIVNYKGHKVLTTSYKLGLGHVNLKRRVSMFAGLSIDEQQMLDHWQSKPLVNFIDKDMQCGVAAKLAKHQKLTPKPNDVIHSPLSEADVLNYSSF